MNLPLTPPVLSDANFDALTSMNFKYDQYKKRATVHKNLSDKF
jgi:hypothetical protein